ncbi:hypothetical protein [Metabacillus fastidiosus]|uniref:hypothetical protein n=1 Tax=Metabacillus fastidiosus TaxID=1458 RepID=UPI002DB8333A|nr:hypothetical protein [Metabacillus fastidiosus]MEC2075841.1 hypothetical protein [Metabacillus fastidiosus]
MSYNIHITRADDWVESEENPIKLEELIDYFSGKSDFEYSETFSTPGPISMSIEADFFIWKHKDIKVPFLYKKGQIVVSRANDEVIEKMKEIATELDARVQGDDGELY